MLIQFVASTSTFANLYPVSKRISSLYANIRAFPKNSILKLTCTTNLHFVRLYLHSMQYYTLGIIIQNLNTVTRSICNIISSENIYNLTCSSLFCSLPTTLHWHLLSTICWFNYVWFFWMYYHAWLIFSSILMLFPHYNLNRLSVLTSSFTLV